MTDDIADRVFGFLKERFPHMEIGATDNIFKLGYVNSLFALELVVFLERSFGITIPNELLRVDNLCSVQAMTELVGKLLPTAR